MGGLQGAMTLGGRTQQPEVIPQSRSWANNYSRPPFSHPLTSSQGCSPVVSPSATEREVNSVSRIGGAGGRRPVRSPRPHSQRGKGNQAQTYQTPKPRLLSPPQAAPHLVVGQSFGQGRSRTQPGLHPQGPHLHVAVLCSLLWFNRDRPARASWCCTS